MKKSISCLVVWTLGLAILGFVASGCGKELKVSVHSSEAEKDKPATQLARRIELTYHDPGGKERMRKSIPVLGLSQPVSAHQDLFKDLDWDHEGSFEARAYSSDGMLLLRGVSRANERDEVDIPLSREASRAALVDSALLRGFRVVDAPPLRDYWKDARELAEAREKGRCVELPPLTVDGATGVFPKLVFVSAIKAPALKFQAGAFDAKAGFQAWGAIQSVPINGSGDAEIELGPKLGDGALLRGPQRFVIRVESDRKEGCFEAQTSRKTQPISVNTSKGPGQDYWAIIYGKFEFGRYRSNEGFDSRYVLEVRASNPNDVPVQVRFTGGISSPVAFGSMHPCYSGSSNSRRWVERDCPGSLELAAEIPPHGSSSLYVFGARCYDGCRATTPECPEGWVAMYLNEKIVISWRVEASVDEKYGGEKMPDVTGVEHIR